LPSIFKKTCKNFECAAPGIRWVVVFEAPIARYYRWRIFGRFVGHFRARLRQILQPPAKKIHCNSRVNCKNRSLRGAYFFFMQRLFYGALDGPIGRRGRTPNDDCAGLRIDDRGAAKPAH
jgi:hypothetical protein